MTQFQVLTQEGPATHEIDRSGTWPGWAPEAARNYLAHIEGGRTIRDLAREAQVHPSTILRQVRRMESSREDPLVDAALRNLAALSTPGRTDGDGGEDAFTREALPVLRQLVAEGAVLAVAREMEKGVVVRERQGHEPERLAVVERRLAEAMALRDWIQSASPEARIRRYQITITGRAVLNRSQEQYGRGFAEAQAGFAGAPVEDSRIRHMRSSLVESPLQALARRRDEKGAPFLTRELVAAGERLRDDFQMARTEGAALLDWDDWLRHLTSGPEERTARSRGARRRVELALDDLGPGLADVMLRCGCLLEGLEQFERRMGWSARSGKVVLKIALVRLLRHYCAMDGKDGAMIG